MVQRDWVCGVVWCACACASNASVLNRQDSTCDPHMHLRGFNSTSLSSLMRPGLGSEGGNLEMATCLWH